LTAANLLIVFALTIATGVQDRPVDAPQEGPWASDWKVVGSPTFAQAMSAVASLVLSYGGMLTKGTTKSCGPGWNFVPASQRQVAQYGLWN
jgi:hypothetical protein